MSYEGLIVDVEDIALVYQTANVTDPTKESEVQYLLGIIEGTLAKYFTTEKKDEDNN